MKFQRRGYWLIAAMAALSISLAACTAQDEGDNGQPGANATASTKQPSASEIDEACNNMPLRPDDVASILKTTIIQAVYADGATLTGYPMRACYYTVDQQRVGGSEQDRRVLEVVLVPDGHGHWARITRNLTGWEGVDVANEGFVATGAAIPTIIFRDGKKVVTITMMAEEGTPDTHKLLRRLGNRAASRL